MREDFAPALHPVEIATLRPTQMTVGLREVDRKRADVPEARSQSGPVSLARRAWSPEWSAHGIDGGMARELSDQMRARIIGAALAKLPGRDRGIGL